MEGELGSGARIAIALIVIGVIISIIFVILGFTRGTTNQGIATVSNSMDSMSLAQFDDYDQKVLSGTQVLSALKLFDGRPVALVVRTQKLTGATLSDMDGNGTGHNYGALLNGVVASSTTTPVTGALTRNGTDSFYTSDLNIDATTKMPVVNPQTLVTTQAGSATYVRPTARFTAELIRDTTDTIVGIAFTQRPN
ncbi:hypothetical protein ACFQZE_10925 [Paenibacillus sp. GCM10027627]|uniref:hypothetical protein n=1 Tax=unclassified Paenibacillus TaxID=185978 RepID=UPI00363B0B22